MDVFRLNGLLIAVGDAMAEPSGQTSARWRVLAAIDEAPLSVAQIARAWWLTRQSVQRVADVLVKDGLAAYEANPSHRRAKLLRITPGGLSALREIRLTAHAGGVPQRRDRGGGAAPGERHADPCPGGADVLLIRATCTQRRVALRLADRSLSKVYGPTERGSPVGKALHSSQPRRSLARR